MTNPCPCGHRHITHRYVLATRDNDGGCLAPGCDCEGDED